MSEALSGPGAPRRPALAALRHRNFRLLWLGQLVSMTGTMMQSAAILWHVSLLAPEGSKGLALGLVGLVRVLPILGFSLVSGVVADALDRRKLMLATQVSMTVFAAILAALSHAGLTSTWPIYLIAALSSAAAAFDNPARQSLVPALVPRESLAGAISLNLIVFHAASVVGPAVGGLVIAASGVALAYALNTLSFVAVIASLLLMRDLPQRAPGERAEVSLAAAREGLRFVFHTPILRSTMLLDFFATFFSSATALLPLFAQDVLDVGARGYGWLYAAPAAGSLLASAVMVRSADGIVRQGRVLVQSVIVYGAATVVFGLSRSFWLTFLALAATGAADTVSTVIRHVIRQMATPDGLRGRMTSVNMVFFMGGPQLGELEAGLVANAFGPAASVVSGGLACIACTAWIARRSRALRDYVRRESAEA